MAYYRCPQLEGIASGTVAQFDTSVQANLLSAKFNVNAVQAGTPWIDSNVIEKEPYNFRKVAGTASRIGNHLFDKLVGGTVSWNQLITFTAGTSTLNGVTYSRSSDGEITLSGTASDVSFLNGSGLYIPKGHKVLIKGCPVGGSANSYYLKDGFVSDINRADIGNGNIIQKQTFQSIRIVQHKILYIIQIILLKFNGIIFQLPINGDCTASL